MARKIRPDNAAVLTCDVPECGNEIVTSAASQPKHWQVLQVGLDNQWMIPPRKETVYRNLCPQCADAIVKLINDYRRPGTINTNWSGPAPGQSVRTVPGHEIGKGWQGAQLTGVWYNEINPIKDEGWQ